MPGCAPSPGRSLAFTDRFSNEDWKTFYNFMAESASKSQLLSGIYTKPEWMMLSRMTPTECGNASSRTCAHARTLASVSACSGDARWAHTTRASSLFMSVLVHTQRRAGLPRRRLCGFFSDLKRLFFEFPPTRSDARPWTLISSPYIHQTGKID